MVILTILENNPLKFSFLGSVGKQKKTLFYNNAVISTPLHRLLTVYYCLSI